MKWNVSLSGLFERYYNDDLNNVVHRALFRVVYFSELCILISYDRPTLFYTNIGVNKILKMVFASLCVEKPRKSEVWLFSAKNARCGIHICSAFRGLEKHLLAENDQDMVECGKKQI
jgi:hypothetical protein